MDINLMQSKQESRVSVVHALVRVAVKIIMYERRVFVICKTLKSSE